jgi:phosphatidylglycerol:prolipoprotein diacylglycerol transferase
MDQAAEGKLFLHGIRFRQPLSAEPIMDAVEPGSAAEKHGLAAGQRIETINGRPVATGHEANLALLEAYGSEKPLAISTQGKSPPAVWKIEAPPRSNPIHPAQLYSAIDAFLLCLLLLAWDPYRQREGELTALTLTLHPISRFLLEIIRVDESAVFGTSMSISQNISLGILLGAIVCWYVVLRRPKGLWKGQESGAWGR